MPPPSPPVLTDDNVGDGQMEEKLERYSNQLSDDSSNDLLMSTENEAESFDACNLCSDDTSPAMRLTSLCKCLKQLLKIVCIESQMGEYCPGSGNVVSVIGN